MNYKIISDKSILRWDEGIPLGNGKTGCLIWGTGSRLRFSLDRIDIWDRRKPINTEKQEYSYATLVKMAREKNTEGIRNFFDKSYNNPFPTKLPAGNIEFSFVGGGNVASVLELQSAESMLEVQTGEKSIKIFSLCHAENKTGMIHIQAPETDFEIRLNNPEYGSLEEKNHTGKIPSSSLKNLCYPPAVFGQKYVDGILFQYFTQAVDEGFSYGIVMAVREEKKETSVFYQILTSEDGKDWLETGIKNLAEQINEGYGQLRISHKKWWETYWNKSAVELPDKLFEKQWYLTNYLFASCSRKGCYPMPLQGVWTADDGNLPPWKGDYHNDLNTQLSYTHFYKANHLEEGESFLDFLWSLKEKAGEFAEKFYHTKGICMPGVMTIDGEPLGGWPMYALSPVQQIWLCQSFDLYYRYTGDEKFLREKAWVYFRETAECITELLEEHEDGYYYLPVSSSPEIHDDEAESWVTPNSNYELALLKYLYSTLTRYAGILKNGQEKKWQDILDKLPDYAVNEKNVMMISPDESLKESHRHLSNAMAVCPLYLMDYDVPKNREIIDATVEDFEILGTGMWVGFSFAWMAHLYAVQRNGEGAMEKLKIFWENFCSPNGFHLNGDFKRRGHSVFHYKAFTLESNMYAADALQEMLLKVRDGKLELFPAVPENWKREEIAFSNLRGEGGILISARMYRGEIRDFQIYSPTEQEIVWRIDEENRKILHLKEKQTMRIV